MASPEIQPLLPTLEPEPALDAISSAATQPGREDLIARVILTRLQEPATIRVNDLINELGAIGAARQILTEQRSHLTWSQACDMAITTCRQANAAGITTLTPASPYWPSRLNDLGQVRPWLLWLRSQAHAETKTMTQRSHANALMLQDLTTNSVSVVGSRVCTTYGRRVTEDLASQLALLGWTVISGGAFGIDAAAHQGALAAGTATVLVSAGGVDTAYPPAHSGLFDRVAQQGLVISEYLPGERPYKHRFLDRNRIIAALSRGTLVVEAASRSGARNTAALARAMARQVMAVPGPVTSPQSAGCLMLLREGDAMLVRDAFDVLELVAPLHQRFPDTEVTRVLSHLIRAKHANQDQLHIALGIDPTIVRHLLEAMQTVGWVSATSQGWQISDTALHRFSSLC